MRREAQIKKRKRISFAPFIALALFFAGGCVFLYPTVSSYQARQRQTSVIKEYIEKTDEHDEEYLKAEMEKARRYNESLAGDPVRDPFVPGTGYALPQNYDEVLNVDGVMGYVDIPKIDVMLPIYHGTSDEVLEKGVGHIEATALPIGGSFSHTVLTGHRGLPNAELFTRLDEIKIGDLFYIHVLNETLAYKVDRISTVLPTELGNIRAERDMDLATLITCTPYGVNTHRLLVRGSRTEYVPQERERAEKEERDRSFTLRLSLSGAIAGAGLLLIVFVIAVKKRKRKNEDE